MQLSHTNNNFTTTDYTDYTQQIQGMRFFTAGNAKLSSSTITTVKYFCMHKMFA